MRDPWCQGEWKGDWSDASPLWEDYPEVPAVDQSAAGEEEAFRLHVKIATYCLFEGSTVNIASVRLNDATRARAMVASHITELMLLGVTRGVVVIWGTNIVCPVKSFCRMRWSTRWDAYSLGQITGFREI